MNKQALYRTLVRFAPVPPYKLSLVSGTMEAKTQLAYQRILRRHRALGGALVLFDTRGISLHLVYGKARKGEKVSSTTAFRLASVSKTVTAAGILAMDAVGMLSINQDADTNLPFSLRHPLAPDTPISLKMLLSHTAGIRDGNDYFQGILREDDAATMLRGDCHTTHLPGDGCEYSNLGLGLAGAVVEAQTGLSFQKAMEQALFTPLGLKAAYYPHLLDSKVADAHRVLPPSLHPNFDGARRQANPQDGWDKPQPLRHHLLAHGACCMDAESLTRLGIALMHPGFFSQESLNLMRTPLGSLHARDPHLRQGLGLFILEDPALCSRPLYGHQGMAYGAVHQMFLDVEQGRGLISLTVGASEARNHIMADINRALLREWQKHG